MDKLMNFLLVALALVSVASAASVSRSKRSSPLVSDLLLPPQKPQQAIPVQPVEESEEEKAEDVVEAAPVNEGSGAAEEEEEAPEVIPEKESEEPEEDQCGDITGVWQSQSSEARLVLVQDAEHDLKGIFRNNSESGYYQLRGHRGHHHGAAFAFSVVWQEGNAVSSVIGHCHDCDANATLEMHSLHSHMIPGCTSHVVSILASRFSKVGSVEQAQTMMQLVTGPSEKEGVVEEESEEEEEEEEEEQEEEEAKGEEEEEAVSEDPVPTEVGSGDM